MTQSYWDRMARRIRFPLILGTVSLVLLTVGQWYMNEHPPANAWQQGSGAVRSTPADTGRFLVHYDSAKTAAHREYLEQFRGDSLLDVIAADLNGWFAIPVDITIGFSECDSADAYYDPGTHTVSVTYEQVAEMRELFSHEVSGDSALTAATSDAIVFILYHELGHALIDVLDLPVTGKEEDAVDQLSTVLLADSTDEGEQAAVDGARFFYLSSSQDGDRPLDEEDFADAHSLDRQRFYYILCMLYGHDPVRYTYLLREHILPEDRATECEEEFDRIYSSWYRLLEPHVKDTTGT